MSVPAAPPTASGASSTGLRAYYELTKPGIALYVTILAASCYLLAGGMARGIGTLTNVIVGMAFATGGALALNQYIEREVDGRMARTRNRPLPSARLSPRAALVFGLVLFLGGCVYLYGTVSPVAAFLTLLSGVAYNGVYTPLKSRSYMATLAGAVPGALPALVGWSAATGGRLDMGAWVLFGVAYLWQMPHVLGLAWVLRSDYAQAGFKLMPPADAEGRMIGLHMILYAAALIPMSLVPTLIGLTGGVYFWGALMLGAWLLWLSAKAGAHMTNYNARKVFLGSLLYQPLLLGLMLVDGLLLR